MILLFCVETGVSRGLNYYVILAPEQIIVAGCLLSEWVHKGTKLKIPEFQFFIK